MISQNKNLLILGAGQYGVMAKEIAEAMGVFDRIAFLDDSFAKDPAAAAEHSIVGTTRDIEKFAAEFRYGFVASGTLNCAAHENDDKTAIAALHHMVPTFTTPEEFNKTVQMKAVPKG